MPSIANMVQYLVAATLKCSSLQYIYLHMQKSVENTSVFTGETIEIDCFRKTMMQMMKYHKLEADELKRDI